ncbi:STRUBBELIG-receptor family 3 [Hibiscus trionum]|uniref:STRUBBELIG-receptor family 3 n=1 Tax=Hibiscus trionum TaxID=183268 RepID=A0A9W7HHJ3_HIBTR|nr:STRUBBELIG-receptor family 3 [Hibiscus trionum]
MGFLSWGIVSVGLFLVLTLPFSAGTTDPRDVSAMNSLYASLGSPPLLGWIPVGGDPCEEEWQGVSCVFSNITEIRLSGLNLGGVLDEGIGGFESMIVMDLSHNQIGGSIPSNIPLTIRNLFLSGNQFNGSIPATLSALTQLTELFLDDNHLRDEIPDSFQELKSLVNLDLSGNNLTGQLPPSFGNLSSLTTLHLQNNKISGVLDVLQDLPLSDLNVENNILSGPIPPKLLNIPNFRKDGNPFNTTILPSPPAALPPFIAGAPYPLEGPRRRPAGGPSSSLEFPQTATEREFWTNKRVIMIAVGGLIALVLGVFLLLVWRCFKGKKNSSNHGADAYRSPRKKLNQSQKSSTQPTYQTEKVDKVAVMKPGDESGLESGDTGMSPKLQDEQLLDATTRPASSRTKKKHEINKGGVDVKSMSIRPPLPPPLCPTVEEGSVSPIMPVEKNELGLSSTGRDSTSLNVSAFSIASLQQYTNSFSEENFIGEGMLGGVYRAELPDGKLLAIKKLDTRASRWKSDAEFLELVSTISKLRHPNIVELVGYCNEYGQRLLVYQYCKNGTLYDALHVDDGMHKKLSWNARVRIALGVARAIQYLHEVCQPPIMHKNIKSVNILLDDKFAVRVSECGLAPLLSSGSTSEFSGSLFVSYGYAAPEIEFGTYTCQSDVYSLGVVMLELLTGRESFDRSRPLGEQFLVRWAIPQLHDIDALVRMVDITLNGAYPVKSLSRFADIISRCVQWEPGFRPPISEIVQDLLHML